MKESQNVGSKITYNKFLVNGIKGFVLAAIPIAIIQLEAMIVKQYSFSFIYKIISDTSKYGIVGIVTSMVYTFSYKFYPKISKYAIWAILIGYYIYATIFFIVGIYFQMTGPLFS